MPKHKKEKAKSKKSCGLNPLCYIKEAAKDIIKRNTETRYRIDQATK